MSLGPPAAASVACECARRPAKFVSQHAGRGAVETSTGHGSTGRGRVCEAVDLHFARPTVLRDGAVLHSRKTTHPSPSSIQGMLQNQSRYEL